MELRWVLLMALGACAGLWPCPGMPAKGAAPTSEDFLGAPREAPGRQLGVYIWLDDRGVHLRWSPGEQPVLFTGALSVDKKPGLLTRFNDMTGGWVDTQDEGRILFSATAVREVDGFDLLLPAGTNVTLQVEIDLQPADVSRVFVGEKMLSPQRLPLRFRV
jgi:hypothetical protein